MRKVWPEEDPQGLYIVKISSHVYSQADKARRPEKDPQAKPI